jgi:chromosomal replication initiation ATPase DnaA
VSRATALTLSSSSLKVSTITRVAPPVGPSAPRSIAATGAGPPICREFGLTRDELLSDAKPVCFAYPRFFAMALSRSLTDASLPVIARAFNRRDHTTVLHAVARNAEILERQPRPSPPPWATSRP